MPHAIVQTALGGPEVLEYREVELAPPGPGEVRLKQSAIGINFHDIYNRDGRNRLLELPGTPGLEAVGEVAALGPGAGPWQVGDKVAYVWRGYGGYASERNIPAAMLVRLPEGISEDLVACSLLRGATVAMLVQKVRLVTPGSSVLVHAASGATGRLICDWAAHLGARVIGTVSSEGRKAAAPASCDALVLNSDPDWTDQVRALAPGGIDYVIDSLGRPTFEGSLSVAAPCGHVSMLGQAGGAVESVAIATLAARSLSVSRPIVFDWYPSGAAVQPMIDDFYALVRAGVLTIPEPTVLPLAEAGRAQTMLEDRGLDRSIILRP
jgi:NADPH2:quinone reductase